MLCLPQTGIKPERFQGSLLPAGFPVAGGCAELQGKAQQEMLFFLRKASPPESERAALHFSQLDVAVTSVFFFLLLGPAAEAAFQTPRANLDNFTGLSSRSMRKQAACIPGAAVSKKALEHSTLPEAIWTAPALPRRGGTASTSTRRPSCPGEVPFGSGSRHIKQGCVKEATALMRGVLRVSGACQAQQTVTGTLHQRGRQPGLGGKISASRGYHCRLARRQQKIPRWLVSTC